MALAKAGSTSYSLPGTAKHICRKFDAYFNSFLGYMNGWPMEYL